MTEPVVVESDVTVYIAKRIRTFYPEGRMLTLPFLSERLVTEASVLWVHKDGEWQAHMADVTSSVPRRDGRPSAMSKTHVLNAGERFAFLRDFPDAAQPPAERVTVTIEGEPQ